MKRVLIITYYWPPAGGPGVQRWLKFVKYLPTFNVQPVVFIPQNPHYPILDPALVAEISKTAEIIKLPIREPYALAKRFSAKKTKQLSSGILPNKKTALLEKLMLWVRGNFFIPDARVGWVAPSVSFLTHYIEKTPVTAVITTGPPHSLHLIGLKL
ncbi:MAG: glycosyl transferase family 1, partial [Marinirhabdus sp.]